MSDSTRTGIAVAADTIVVKVGTRVLTHESGVLDEGRIAALASDVDALLQAGRRVVVVSSGAVGSGMGRLGLARRPTDLARLQAVAAVGQSHLVEVYERSLRRHGRHAAQVLLTAQDLDDRARYLNVRNTLRTLLEYGAVPIVNENDTVSVEELQTTFGDNDRLAALVTNLLRAPLLVLLSDVAGLFDGDPAQAGSRLISLVPRLDDSILALVRDRATGVSKGGMASKLAAARIVTAAGESAIIASGRETGVLQRIVAGEVVGTLIPAQGAALAARKRWIGYTVQPRGYLVVDDGACRALQHNGRSLLAIGVREAGGDFSAGDVVAVRDPAGREIARGLCNYPLAEVQRIAGRRTDEIAAALGHRPFDEVIHRDNMVLTGS
jgi:glutamate 5-kinase